MLKAILFSLIILTTSAVAESTICEDFVPLDKVKNICGKEFLKDETKTRKGKCTIIYIDREMGEKYVEGIGSSPLLLMQSIHQIDISGNNTAPVVFKKTLDLAMNLGVFKKNISGLGESAFYHERGNSQTVTWYEGEYLYNFDVRGGREESDDAALPSPCTADQTIEIARLIGVQNDS